MFENELSQFDEIYEKSPFEKMVKPSLSDGEHKGQVVSILLTKTKRNETPMIIITFIDKSTDWEIDIPFFLTIKSVPFIKPSLVALGFPLTGKFSDNLQKFCEEFKIPKHVILEKKTNKQEDKEYINYIFYPDFDHLLDNDNVPF